MTTLLHSVGGAASSTRRPIWCMPQRAGQFLRSQSALLGVSLVAARAYETASSGAERQQALERFTAGLASNGPQARTDAAV